MYRDLTLKQFFTVQGKIEFFSDWDRGVSGTVGRGEVRHILNDFAMKLTALVKAGTHTGYLCELKREHDKETRYSAYSLIPTPVQMIIWISENFVVQQHQG